MFSILHIDFFFTTIRGKLCNMNTFGKLNELNSMNKKNHLKIDLHRSIVHQKKQLSIRYLVQAFESNLRHQFQFHLNLNEYSAHHSCQIFRLLLL